MSKWHEMTGKALNRIIHGCSEGRIPTEGEWVGLIARTELTLFQKMMEYGSGPEDASELVSLQRMAFADNLLPHEFFTEEEFNVWRMYCWRECLREFFPHDPSVETEDNRQFVADQLQKIIDWIVQVTGGPAAYYAAKAIIELVKDVFHALEVIGRAVLTRLEDSRSPQGGWVVVPLNVYDEEQEDLERLSVENAALRSEIEALEVEVEGGRF